MYESIPNELRTMEAGSKRMDPYKRGLLHRAAKAIEELSMKLHGSEAAIAGMKREIERMVVAGKPRWIPVTERLPENDDFVIVTVLDEHGDTPYKYSDFGWYLEAAKVWIVDTEQRTDITHWMPLPEPPKEEEE